ncbi:MAG: hypothetical protein NC301_07525 [Bacteroides sp.]|nr:hypothetical protein [Bacteroides sp.]MCM1379983.1 hypothetical protein [Bacteroides sp.]MCM1446337.1 hypothetical protein [Prevotella sp.]
MIYANEALAAVSCIRRISVNTIVSANREYRAVEARMFVILLLKADGNTDVEISWVVNRDPGMVRKARKRAELLLQVSIVFNKTYSKIKAEYERQKSLRISRG